MSEYGTTVDQKPKQTRTFTAEQAAVISARQCSVLVAASAGTGKTYTLTHRIINRILDPHEPLDLERLLVVTFTDAAAKEMRDRIRAALTNELKGHPDNSILKQQVEKVGSAQISTIHSFCREILRRYSYLLGLEPSLPVIDEAEASILKTTVVDRLFEERYMADDPGFIDLLDSYSRGLGDNRLKETVMKVYQFTTSIPNVQAWKDNVLAQWDVAPKQLPGHPWLQVLRQQVKSALQWNLVQMERAIALCQQPGGPQVYIPQLLEEKTALVRTLEALSRGSWEEIPDSLPVFATLKQSRSKDVDEVVKKRVKDLRDSVKKSVNGLRKGLFGRTLDQYGRDLPTDRMRVSALLEIVDAFDREYTALKRQLGVVDFSDLERLCLQILTTSYDSGRSVAEHVREQYDEVLVDEYQDTSQIQDRILYLVSSDPECQAKGRPPNRVLIGDVKQSIYRFRLADPSLFVEKLRAYKADETSAYRQIPLSQNFRSRPEILEAVNFVFQQIMTEAAAEVDYTPDDFLTCGASWYSTDAGQPSAQGRSGKNVPVELYLLDSAHLKGADTPDVRQTAIEDEGELSDDDDDLPVDRVEYEANFMARRIRELVDDKTEVFDSDSKKYRPLRYGDIAVLVRSTANTAETIRQVLESRGIPAFSFAGSPVLESPEVKLLVALLQVIDNPYLSPQLAAVLLSRIGGFTPQDLAVIQSSYREGELYDSLLKAAFDDPEGLTKAGQFLDRLRKWRCAAQVGPSHLIRVLLSTLGPAAFIEYAPDLTLRKRHLRQVLEMAEAFEENHLPTLSGFIHHLLRVRDEGRQDAAAGLSDFDVDAVKIMSIHKSKGLEFPVVFLPNLTGKLNLSDSYGDIQFESEIGIALKHVDTVGKEKWSTLSSQAAAFVTKRKALAEEMRILYVAMTRARERLILVGSTQNPASTCTKWAESVDLPDVQLPTEQLLSATNVLDWIGPALVRHRDGQVLREIAQCQQAPACIELARYPCSWYISVGRDVTTPGEATSPIDETNEFDDLRRSVRRLEPVPVPESALLTPRPARDLEHLLCWKYRHPHWKGIKQSYAVTDLAEGYQLPAEAPRISGRSPGHKSPLQQTQNMLTAKYPAGNNALGVLSKPDFVVSTSESAEGVQRGNAVHRFLQMVPLSPGLTDPELVKEIANKLTAAGKLLDEDARWLDPELISRFFTSDLGQLLFSPGSKVEREVPFTIALPLTQVHCISSADETNDWELSMRELSAGEFTILRGIVDMIITRPEGLIVVDFKTDKVSPEEAYKYAARYFAQVQYYMKALKRVRRCSICGGYLAFLAAGVNISVPVES